eukprot:6289804-Amphidinium_carterae.7
MDRLVLGVDQTAATRVEASSWGVDTIQSFPAISACCASISRWQFGAALRPDIYHIGLSDMRVDYGRPWPTDCGSRNDVEMPISLLGIVVPQLFDVYSHNIHNDADVMSSEGAVMCDRALPRMCVRTKSGSALHERLSALGTILAVLGTVACLHFSGNGSLYTFAPFRCPEFGLPKDVFTYPTICCHPAVHIYQGGAKRRAPVPLRARQKTKNLKKQPRSEAVISLSSDELSLIMAPQDRLSHQLAL